MRKIAGLVGFSLLILAGCKTSTPPASNNSSPQVAVQSAQTAPATPPQPKYGWKTFHEETFETHPVPVSTYQRIFAIPRKASKLRVTINASSAVLGGSMSQIVFATARKPLRTAAFIALPCSLISVDKEETSCNIDPDSRMLFVVRDARAEGTDAGGLFGFIHHSNRLAERAALPNKVQISLAIWACVENCSNSND